MAKIVLEAHTRANSGGYGKASNTEKEIIDILASIWDNRFNLSPSEINMLSKFGSKTLYEQIKLIKK